MAILIEKIDEKAYGVNGKVVQQDMDGTWVTKFEELTPNEWKEFKNHVLSQENECNKKEVQGLKEASLPLIKYLNNNHHPHTKVIIDNTSVELVEGKIGVFNIEEFLKD